MARAPKAAPASGGPGHNSGALDDEHLQALHISNHLPLYERALKAKKDADATFKNACKTIKSEGGSIEDIKLTIQLRTPEGEALLKARIEAQMRTARWAGVAIGTQADMFAPDPRSLRERAFDEGKRAGLAGEPLNIPASYSPGSDGDIGFKEGWHHGQTLLAGKIKPTPASEAESGLIQKPGADAGPDAFDKDESLANRQDPPPIDPPAGDAVDPPKPAAAGTNDWPDEVAAARSKKGKQQPKGSAVA